MNPKTRGLSSYSFDESSIPHFHKLKARKTQNAYLPVPTHVRTTSSPCQLLEIKDRPLSTAEEKTHKKLSLDCSPKRTASDTSDKSKRSSSSASDKSQRNRYDEAHFNSRTPSERSFVVHTPETPKCGPVATPELLAELLKGSSEKLTAEQHQSNTNQAAASAANSAATAAAAASDCDLPPAILKYLVSADGDYNFINENRSRATLRATPLHN